MAHFKALTTGKTVLMGRKTWESIPEKFRPLPNRKNIVITHQSGYPVPPGVEVHRLLESAFAQHADEDIFVIGGAAIYEQTVDIADRLEITEVKKSYVGDVFFPKINSMIWQEKKREPHEAFDFITYEPRF